MKSYRLVAVLAVAALTYGGQAQAYDSVIRDAGSKIRGDYYPGSSQARQNVVVRRAPTMQNNVVAPAPQVVAAPVAPAPNTTAQADNAQRRSTRTFSVAPNSQPTTVRAPIRSFRRNRGWNLNAGRKITGDYGYPY